MYWKQHFEGGDKQYLTSCHKLDCSWQMVGMFFCAFSFCLIIFSNNNNSVEARDVKAYFCAHCFLLLKNGFCVCFYFGGD